MNKYTFSAVIIGIILTAMLWAGSIYFYERGVYDGREIEAEYESYNPGRACCGSLMIDIPCDDRCLINKEPIKQEPIHINKNGVSCDNCTIDEPSDLEDANKLPECGEVLQNCKMSGYKLSGGTNHYK